MKLTTIIKGAVIGALLFSLVSPAYGALDRKSKVSTNDQTAGYLNGKIVAGTNVTLVEGNDGGNETLTINASTTASGIILDLADDASNESTAITEIATSGDTNGVITEPSADKMLIDFSNAVPLADALAANGTNASAGNAILGVDASGNAEGAFDVIIPTEIDTEAEVEALLTDVSNVFTNNDTIPVANGGTNITTPTDDAVMVGNGSAWQQKVIPACEDSLVDKLLYDQTTNTFSCVTDQTGSGIGYTTVAEEGSGLTQRGTINYIGTAVTCVDNAGSGRTDCTFTGGGAAQILDLGDDASNESTNLAEIATVGDTNNIFSSPIADKVLVNVALNWPTSDTANTGDSATSFWSAGQCEHERGCLEADVSAFSGLVSISAGATSQVTTKAGLETLITDVSDFAEADGDIYSGTHDFGSATGVEIENNATLSLTNDGEVGIDTTDDQLQYRSSSLTRVLSYKRDKSFILPSPSDADRIIFYSPFDPITVTDIDCIVDPADTGESVVIALYESDGTGDFTDLGTNGLDGATTITCDNDGALDDGTLSNPTIDAGDYIGIDVGTVTGTVSNLTVTFVYTMDAE